MRRPLQSTTLDVLRCVPVTGNMVYDYFTPSRQLEHGCHYTHSTCATQQRREAQSSMCMVTKMNSGPQAIPKGYLHVVNTSALITVLDPQSANSRQGCRNKAKNADIQVARSNIGSRVVDTAHLRSVCVDTVCTRNVPCWSASSTPFIKIHKHDYT